MLILKELENEVNTKSLDKFSKLKLILKAIKRMKGNTCIDKIINLSRKPITDLERSFLRDILVNIYTDRKIDLSSYHTYMHTGELNYSELDINDFLASYSIDKVPLHYLIEKLTLDGVVLMVYGMYKILIRD